MNETPPKKRWPYIPSGIGVPKNAITIGIIVGGILGSTLALITLRIIRPAAEEVDPAELTPVRAIPPRPKSPTATPAASAVPPKNADDGK